MLQNAVRIARQHIEELHQSQLNEECTTFFRGIESVHPSRRTSMTCRYLKRFRRKKLANRGSLLTAKMWETELRNASIGTPPENIAEDDFVPLGPPPTVNDVLIIIQSMKNGTSPGPSRAGTV